MPITAVFSRILEEGLFNPNRGMPARFPGSLKECLELEPAVLIIDEALMPPPAEIDEKIKILVVGEATKEKVLRSIGDYRGFSGFIDPGISAHLLEKAIKCVEKGELWVSREMLSLIQQELSGLLKKKHYDDDLLKLFSRREKEVLELISRGYGNKAVAEALFISDKTVKTHLYKIYKKLDVKNRTEAVAILFRS